MLQISYQIIAAAGVNIIIILLFGRRLRFGFLIISSWWFFWLFVSSLSLTGVFVPSNNTYYLYFLLLSSMTFGGMIFFFANAKYTIMVRYDKPKQSEDLDSDQRFEFIIRLMKWVVLPIILFFCIRAIRQLFSMKDFVAYRRSFFGIGTEKDLIFGYGLIHFAYDILILPILYAAFFIGAAVYTKTGKIKLFILSTAGFILDGIMQLGRFQLYFIILFSLITIFLRSGRRITKIFSKFLYIALVLVLLFPILYISLLRSSSFDIQKAISTFIVEYHTIGFTIFDKEYNNSDSLLNNSISYGRASLGSIERIFAFFFNRLDNSIISIPDVIGRNLNDNTSVGFNELGYIYANAFSTILYPIYMDGRLVFVIIMPLIYGYYLMRFSLLSSEENAVKELSYLFALLYLALFGIFQPLITSSCWLYIISISILFKRKKYYLKKAASRRYCES